MEGEAQMNNREALLSSFDTDGLDWVQASGHVDTLDFDLNRFVIGGILRKLSKRHDMCIFYGNNIKDTNTSLFYKILKRIGSDSRDAEVYLVEFNYKDYKYLVAAKLLVETMESDKDKNQTEIEIATLLSDAVMNGLTISFPLVYGVYDCNNIKLSSQGDLYHSCLLRNVNDYLLGIGKSRNQVRRFMHINKLKSKPELLEKVAEFVGNKFVGNNFAKLGDTSSAFASGEDSCDVILHTDRFKGHVMFSELAWGDLANFLEQCHFDLDCKQKTKMIRYIITGIYKGIRDLQMFSVVHRDLHLGNVLIKIVKPNNVQYNIIPLIHDFGHSVIVTEWTPEDYTSDFEKITSTLTTNLHVPMEVKESLRNLLNASTFIPHDANFMDIIIEKWGILSNA